MTDELKKIIANTCDIEPAKLKDPRIKIIGVESDLNDNELTQAFINQNLSNYETDSVKVVHIRTNGSTYVKIIHAETKPRIFHKLINLKF